MGTVFRNTNSFFTPLGEGIFHSILLRVQKTRKP